MNTKTRLDILQRAQELANAGIPVSRQNLAESLGFDYQREVEELFKEADIREEHLWTRDRLEMFLEPEEWLPVERPRVIEVTDALRLELKQHNVRWRLWKGYPVIDSSTSLVRVRSNLERYFRGSSHGSSEDLRYMVSAEYNKQIERLRRSGA